MRICIINEYFHPDNAGGTGTVLSELARTLVDRHDDVEIDVITSRNLYRGAAELAWQENWNGIEITRIASPKPNGLSTPRRLAANLDFSAKALFTLLRRKRYDAVLIGTAPPTVTLAAAWYKRLTGRPFVYVVYDLEPDRAVLMNVLNSSHPAARFLGNQQRRWLHTADKVVVLGRCMRDFLAGHYGLPHSRMEVVATGADAGVIVPSSRSSRFREQHAIAGFTVLYSGNFGRYHDFDTILDAASSLQAAEAQITFVLVGDGAQREYVAGRVRDEDLKNVRMFSFVPQTDYSDLLATADVSLVTLEPGMEGLCVPSKFYSILASGRPTVAMMSPECEVARVLDEAECGVHLPQGDSKRLAAVLTELAADPARAATMGENARMTLMQNYSNEHIAHRYYQVFTEVLGGQIRRTKQDGASPFLFRPAPPEMTVANTPSSATHE